MAGVEKIYHKKQCIAMVFRKNMPVDGVQFLTDATNPFQVGMHFKKKGVALTPHIHRLDKPIVIDVIQEILFVQKGKIRVTMYAHSGKAIDKKILKTGDSMLLMKEGHGVEFLEDSKLFEIKQGPYPGLHKAKIYL